VQLIVHMVVDAIQNVGNHPVATALRFVAAGI
jgi:hypothetical protein